MTGFFILVVSGAAALLAVVAALALARRRRDQRGRARGFSAGSSFGGDLAGRDGARRS